MAIPGRVDGDGDGGGARGAGLSRADLAMDRYADGDDGAFAEVYDEIAPRLFRFALRQLRGRAAAEDIVQETLLQIHRARDRFASGAPVLPWAYAIARRLIIDASRRSSRGALGASEAKEREREREEPSAAASPEEALHLKRSEAALQRELAHLPSAWRAAFELLKLEQLSVAVAAQVLGITEGMVKIRAHRATKALRALHHERERGPDQRDPLGPNQTEASI
jgi:RNA polymerase sigma-70 factor, ECF subfamily